WYNVPTGGTAMASTDALATGTYYVTQTISGCESTRLSVSVTVNVTPQPGGATTQAITVNTPAEATIEDLVATGTGIIWYPTLADAQAGTNAIPAGTQLVNGSTYYATQTVSGCASTTALAVTVTVTLGTSSFDKNQFKYYPNPVIDNITFSYAEPINTIEVFNMLGQRVIYKTVNMTTIEIDMTQLAAGTYTAHLKSGDAKEIVKVVKR
ncbi:T9SS type A sorting domain-containing protein, partial [Flavobacterium sp. 40-81]